MKKSKNYILIIVMGIILLFVIYYVNRDTKIISLNINNHSNQKIEQISIFLNSLDESIKIFEKKDFVKSENIKEKIALDDYDAGEYGLIIKIESNNIVKEKFVYLPSIEGKTEINIEAKNDENENLIISITDNAMFELNEEIFNFGK